MRILSWVTCFGICLAAISTAFAQLPCSSDGMRVADCVPTSGSATSAPVHPAVTTPISAPSFTATRSLNPESIPFQVSQSFGLILIRAEVNGNAAIFILDTGSNHTIVSSRFVDVATPPLKNTVASEKGSGLSGRGVFTKASLKVGPLVLRDHRILAMDMKEISKSFGQNIDGLLGMDFLNEFETVVVDLKQHRLLLRQ